MQKDLKTAFVFGAIALGLLGLILVLRSNNSPSLSTTNGVVQNEQGVQIIDLIAKGGFAPSLIHAKAGVPTQIRVATNSTYDCSSTLLIPAIGYQKTLRPTGTETIALTAEQATGTLEGMCGMGMYTFDIAFKE